ncbi:hypothetical protein R6V09_01565 [Streptomyces sp. W16]|uniref:hypothetical protein n=1 Tax=Streptomyces sp. W16 TaxID=3076631 RepID=UPI00295AFF86|nr:hypothetical protein [Streptomyces sp. W16]MDV9168833.1 hypothetical protein [Streptomyces sp. W16]
MPVQCARAYVIRRVVGEVLQHPADVVLEVNAMIRQPMTDEILHARKTDAITRGDLTELGTAPSTPPTA